MRIVSGKYKSRTLLAPKGRAIRPTSDKVRGAVFNALRSLGAVEGAQVLDIFCGTGALGLEALSQGAQHCTFMDNSRTSLDLARKNANTLGAGDEVAFLFKDALKPGPRPDGMLLSDLVFLDPPYGKRLGTGALFSLIGQNWLNPACVIVLEEEKSFDFSTGSGGEFAALCEILSERTYGETKITILRLRGVG